MCTTTDNTISINYGPCIFMPDNFTSLFGDVSYLVNLFFTPNYK